MNEPHGNDAMPFVAPCRQLSPADPLRWLARGWRDFRRAPRQSLEYGMIVVALSYIVSWLAYQIGSFILLLSVLSGFVLIGPVMAMLLYSISRQLGRGEQASIRQSLRSGRRHMGSAMVFALVLLVIFLLWARAASMVHVFFPMEGQPTLSELAPFLGVGSAVGAVFASLVFSNSAFALPMLMDRKVDIVTAVVTSINTVLRNKGAMFVWVLLILGLTLVGFMTAFLGLAIVLPVLGYATWHSYVDTIDAGAWPEHGATMHADD